MDNTKKIEKERVSTKITQILVGQEDMAVNDFVIITSENVLILS